MFNKNVIDVLTQINGITNSVILRYPTTIAVSETKDMMVHVDISALDSDSFTEIGLKDSLDTFLKSLKMTSDKRKITIDGSKVIAKENNLEITHIADSLELLKEYNKSPEQFTRTEQNPTVASFDLNVDDIKTLKSGSGIYKDLSEIIFTSQGGKNYIALGTTNKFNTKSSKVSIEKSRQATQDFEIKIPVDNFKKLPQTNYRVEIKYNAEKDSYRILLLSEVLEGFKILLSTKS